MPADVCGIYCDQAVDQAQREPADATLREVGFKHRRTEGRITPAAGDGGAELEPDRLEDLLVQAWRE